MRVQGQITAAEFRQRFSAGQPAEKPKGNKFGAKAQKAGFEQFDSSKEMRVAQDLAHLKAGGYLDELTFDKRELRYNLEVNGVHIAVYEADARFRALKDFELSGLGGVYELKAGEIHVVDCKSPPTRKKREYVLKKNLVFAIHRIRIVEL